MFEKIKLRAGGTYLLDSVLKQLNLKVSIPKAYHKHVEASARLTRSCGEEENGKFLWFEYYRRWGMLLRRYPYTYLNLIIKINNTKFTTHFQKRRKNTIVQRKKNLDTDTSPISSRVQYESGYITGHTIQPLSIIIYHILFTTPMILRNGPFDFYNSLAFNQ